MKVIERKKIVKPKASSYVLRKIKRSGEYFIDGNPTPMARPRLSVNHVYDPQKRLKFGAAMQIKSQHSGTAFTGPLKLDVIFFMQMPERLTKSRKAQEALPIPHWSRPDLDNCIKLVCDVCQNAGLFKDDAQIAVINASKVYSTLPRTEFTLTEI